MNETKKDVQAQGAETINFANVEEKMKAEVEQLRNELTEAKKKAEQYKDWWFAETEKTDKQAKTIEDLSDKLDKMAAIAEMYIKSQAWKK